MKIGVIVAMEKEFVLLCSLLTQSIAEKHNGKEFILGTMGANEIIVQQCGIGKVNSAIGAVEMITRYRPDLVISTGVAGGANVQLNVAEAVVSTHCVYHDAYCGEEGERGQILGMPARFVSPEVFVKKALSLSVETPIHAGEIVTGDWFVDSREKMQHILDHFPDAMAVDMESCSIAQTCHIYGVPFLSFRIISDVPLKDHKASQYFDFWTRIADSSFSVTRTFLENL